MSQPKTLRVSGVEGLFPTNDVLMCALRGSIERNGGAELRSPATRRVRLMELNGGTELVDLPLPDSRPILPGMAFSPDGSKLAARVEDGVRMWDLRRGRRELAQLQLDWSSPSLPPEVPESGTSPQVVLEAGTLNGESRSER